MTPEEMILALRICGNHPACDNFGCLDCPWEPNCNNDGGGAELILRAADVIQQLLQEKKESETKWISTEERLPEEGERVLIARVKEPEEPMRVEQAIRQEGGWWKVYGANLRNVPYWMPMPEAPEETA